MRSITLTGADGSTWDLCSGDVQAGTDPALWGTAPAVVTEEARLSIPGASVVNARHTSRDMVLPLRIRGDIERNIAALARAVDPTRGDVVLTVERPDGTARQIDARAIDGLQAIPLNHRESTRASTALSLRAMHPYWRSTTAVAVTIDPPEDIWNSGLPTLTDEPIGYDAPLPYSGVQIGDVGYDDDLAYDAPLPYDGAAGETVVMTFDVNADVTAWPTWTVRGSCSAVSAANLTTGESWRLPDGLGGGEVMVVTTRPGERSVRVDGSLALPRMLDGVRLWGLRPGTNIIAVQFAGRGPSANLAASWELEWLTC